MQTVTLIQAGRTKRLDETLSQALSGCAVERIAPDALSPLSGRRILFALGADALGPDENFTTLLRALRANPEMFHDCVAGVIADTEGELYLKDAAHCLIQAANAAGCRFVGRSLIEGTKSLRNFYLLSRLYGIGPLETYRQLSQRLVARIAGELPKPCARPRLAVLHSSNRATSNTLYAGGLVLDTLREAFDITEIALQNGTVYDCRGCSHKTCSHFSETEHCFYGGVVADEVYPAVISADAVLFLCANYNDALSANIAACINRFTALSKQNTFYSTRLYAVIVSGYGGGDIVARQLLGALNVNKTFLLPPRFSLCLTANEPGELAANPDAAALAQAFAESIKNELLAPVTEPV